MAQNNKSRLLGQSKTAFINYLSEHKVGVHNYNQKTIFWDREHVYNENLMLRNKIKELECANMKTKTRLRKSQKEVVDLTTRSKPKVVPDLTIFRSTSSSQLMRQDSHLLTMRQRIDSLKQQQHIKKLLLLRKRIVELKQSNQKLKDENIQLKKSLKYTRMSQLQSQNLELQEQIQRLKRIINQNLKIRQQMLHVFAQQKQHLRLSIRKQIQAKYKLSKQLKNVKEELEQLSRFTVDRATIKKWSEKIKLLEEENNSLKMHISTTKSQMIQSHQKQENTKLEYSQSIVSQNVKIDVSPQIVRNRQQAPSEELTSLELLTVKNTQQYATPLKMPQNKAIEPSSEPLLQNKQKNSQPQSQRQNPQPIAPSTNLPKPPKIHQQQEQQLSQQYNKQQQFQDLMQSIQ